MDMRVKQTFANDWLEDPSVLNAFPTGVIVCDEHAVIINCNDELCKQFGYSKSELLNHNVETMVPESLRPQHSSHFSKYISSPDRRGMGSGSTLYARRKDGTLFPVEIGLNPVSTTQGYRVVATVVDISTRVQVEQNFQNIVEAAPVGMLLVDQSGNIILGNSQLANIFGYTPDELVGQSMDILLPERHRQHHTHYRKSYLQKPSTRSMGIELDLTGLHKSGMEIPVEVGLNPIETAKGMITVATIIDITGRKKAELKLKQANADLDEFTYVASHDLKSPLRGISSLVEWIAEDLGTDIPDDVTNNLQRVHIRIERMEKLVDDLLAYARSGRQQGDALRIKIQKLIDNVLQVVSPPDNFTVRVESDVKEIHSSATPLETVLRNLVSNAIKHHDREQGCIRIRVRAEGSYCIFDIEDDGPGIPDNAHQRVFKLFQALSSKDGTRSGVGLAVSKRLVESHGGKIELHSDESRRGTCFRFWWPRFARRDLSDE